MNAKPENPTVFAQRTQEICRLYRCTPLLHSFGVHVISLNEMIGIQALKRLHPTLPIKPGLVECREFEYLRHGTLSLIAGLDVATGEIVASSMAPTRNETDFARHVTGLIQTDPEGEWVFIADGLNTHQSESLVRLVAGYCDLDEPLGMKGTPDSVCIYVQTLFLVEPNRDLVQYPGSSVTEAQQLQKHIEFTEVNFQFVAYFNETKAKPFKWTYKRKSLCF